MPIDSVLEHLSQAAGYIIIKDAPVDGRVTVLSSQPISGDEAVLLLDTVLRVNGLTVIKAGRTLRVVAADKARHQSVPVHFGADPAEIEPTNELITQVIPVKNIDAVKLRTDLTPLFSTDADVTANGGSNAIIITDVSSSIRRVVQIISELDKNEPSNAEFRSFPLKNSNAVATAKLILSILRPPPDPQVRPSDGKQREPQEQASRAKINAVADDRTNTLFVTGSREAMALVENVLKELESNPEKTEEIRLYSPKFADAVAAAKLITAVFKSPDEGPRNPDAPPPKRDDQLKARVVAAADAGSNTLVVTAPADTLKIIDDIIKHLDVNPSDVTEVKVLTLTYADATAAAKLLTTIFRPEDNKPATPDGGNWRRQLQTPDQAVNVRVNAAADDRINAIVVTAPKETIKVVEGVLKLLDVNPASAPVTKMYPLKYADASAAVRLLTSLYKTDDPTAVPGTAKAPGDNSTVADRQRRARLTIASDDRTNSVVVSAPPEMIADVEGVIKELDGNPVSTESFFIYHLKNGQSANIEAVMNTLFGTVGPQSATAGGRAGQSLQRGGGVNGANAAFGAGAGLGAFGGASGGTGIGSRRGTQSNSFGVGYGGGYPGLGNVAGQGNQQLSPGSMRAVTELTGQVYVVADQDTNSLLVTTATKYQERVKQIIEELDRAVPQVLIKVLVAEVTHDDSADLGVDFSVLNRRTNGNGQSLGTNLGNAAAATAEGGLVVNLVETNVTATLHALATMGKLDVLSRPYILASDNQLASITVGQEVPFITNSRTTDLGQTINTIEYQDVGIILNVTPHINPDGQVIMDVAPEISQLTGTSVPISQNASAPVIAKRSAESRVGVKNGHTIVIGGLMEDRKTQTIAKVPLLGDLPMLGPIFSRQQATKTKTELLIFLTPHVALQPDLLKPMTDQEIRGTTLTPNAVQPGTFKEHLRGMERGSTDITTRPAAIDPVAVPAIETKPSSAH